MLKRTLLLALLLFPIASAPAAAADLWVGGGRDGCSDALKPAQVSSRERTWCTLGRAAQQAGPGDTVHVLPATYRGTVRFGRSGTEASPIRFVAAGPGVVVDADGADRGLKLMGVSDVQLSGLTVTGAGVHGIWVQGGTRVRLTDLTVAANRGEGIAIRRAGLLRLADSTVEDNGGAGVMELPGTTGARYLGNTISGNGARTAQYNGDGIQLGGVGGRVAWNRILRNGDSAYEHGVYTSADSSRWAVEHNTIADNSGANMKAEGGTGLVERNRLTNGRYGLLLSDDDGPIRVEQNVIGGRAQHLVFMTAGAKPARARLWANTVVQSGRSTASGDASAVFVEAAASLQLRSNLLCYDGADSRGVGLWINDARRLGDFASNANWFCAEDAKSRQVAWNGSRTTLAGWRATSGQDARSVMSWAPRFDSALRVTSTNWGASRGDNLGLAEDFAGAALPQTGRVDIGAFESG